MLCRARVVVGLILAVAYVAAPAAAWGQWGMGMAATDSSHVVGQGTAMIKKSPTLLRMHLVLTFKGKNVEEAIAMCRARRQVATEQLEKLGADKKSIEFSAPAVSQADSQRKRQLEMLIRQRLRSAGKSAKKVKPPETITLSSTVTAEWPLAAKDAEEAFVTAYKLQEQIKAAKLATGEGESKASEEEKEMMEELGAEMESYMSMGEEEGDPNAPLFLYVAKISAEEKAKAVADAYQKARNNAEQIARAAGVRLGSLAGLNSTSAGRSGMNYNYAYNDSRLSRAMHMYLERQQMGDGESGEDEAMGNDASQVTFNVGVMASFRPALGDKDPAKGGTTP